LCTLGPGYFQQQGTTVGLKGEAEAQKLATTALSLYSGNNFNQQSHGFIEMPAEASRDSFL
jgi:hypothetical protein